MSVFKKKKKTLDNKFCPVCGTRLSMSDAYCTTCGYSFESRNKKTKKRIKWKNLVILIIILLIIYIVFQYITKQPIVPDSLKTFLNFTQNSTN